MAVSQLRSVDDVLRAEVGEQKRQLGQAAGGWSVVVIQMLTAPPGRRSLKRGG